MAAIGLGRADILPHLRKGVDIACENSPDNITLSGDKEQLDTIIQSLKINFPDIFVRLLRVDVAYHSGESFQPLDLAKCADMCSANAGVWGHLSLFN